MNSNNYTIIIIGASIASISFIRTLKQNNYQHRILLIHGEDRLPYKRTKINKHIVRGFEKDEFRMVEEEWLASNKVDLLYDRADDINKEDKIVKTQKNGVFQYQKLLLATGSVAVKPQINGIDVQDLLSVQNAVDVEQLLVVAKNKQRFLIIGAGVEGIETADQLVRKGKRVCVVNRMKYPLQKLFPEALAMQLLDKMNSKGVKMLAGVTVTNIKKTNSGEYEVQLKGEKYKFDAIVACTGSVPNTFLAKQAGLKVERGILVDEFMNTSDPDVLSAGDVAQHAKGITTGLWHAAEHQGKLAALNILNKAEAHTLPPFRLKTEVFDLFMFSAGYESVIPNICDVVEERDKDIHRILYFENNKLRSVVLINDANRAKSYQTAMFEQWSKEKVAKEVPLPLPLAFGFKPSF